MTSLDLMASTTSYFAALTMLTLIVGYVRAIATNRHGPVFHLVVSICLVFFAYVARTLYWDTVYPSLDADLLGGRGVNIFFDGLAVWGGVHGHIAIFKMIPEEDRSRWTPLTAWLYPPFTVLGPLRRMFRWLF